jgi:hypothetical protein
MIIEIAIIIVVCTVLNDHGRPVLAAIAAIRRVQRVCSVGTQNTLIKWKLTIIHLVGLLH